MYKNFDPKQPYFYAVAMTIILAGCLVLSVGIVELISNLHGDSSFSQPFTKIIGGLVVLALGYIHLELELLRIKK